MNKMSRIARKSVFGNSDKVRNKPGCTVTEDDNMLEICDLGSQSDCTIYIAKVNVLINSAVTAHLICAFVFAYAKFRFSHDVAHTVNKSLFLFLHRSWIFDTV